MQSSPKTTILPLPSQHPHLSLGNLFHRFRYTNQPHPLVLRHFLNQSIPPQQTPPLQFPRWCSRHLLWWCRVWHQCYREATIGAPRLGGSRHRGGLRLLDAGRLWENLARDLCAREFHRNLIPLWTRKQGKHYMFKYFDWVVLTLTSFWILMLVVHRGRFGVIRECRENATGNLFLAKIVPYEAESKQEVLQEYEILKSLHHERIMALHEAYVTPRYLVLISEYCSGKELLFSLIDRWGRCTDEALMWQKSISVVILITSKRVAAGFSGSVTQRMMWWPTSRKSSRVWTTSIPDAFSTWTSSQRTSLSLTWTSSRSSTSAVLRSTTPSSSSSSALLLAHWSICVRDPFFQFSLLIRIYNTQTIMEPFRFRYIIKYS